MARNLSLVFKLLSRNVRIQQVVHCKQRTKYVHGLLYNLCKCTNNVQTAIHIPAVTSRALYHRSSSLLKAHTEDIDVIVDVTYEEVVDGVKDGTVRMMDVRNPGELIQTGTIGAPLNIPVQELGEALSLSEEDFEDKYNFSKTELSNENLVVYCLAGLRAKVAVQLLHKAGFKKARRYPGSWEEWVEKQK